MTTTYDTALKRYRASCNCGYEAVRAKKEAAEHLLAQHVAYSHDGKEPRKPLAGPDYTLDEEGRPRDVYSREPLDL